MAVADIVIKQESIEAVDLESKILELCKDNMKGITDAIIQQSMPSIPAQQRVMAINRLLSTVWLLFIDVTNMQRSERGANFVSTYQCDIFWIFYDVRVFIMRKENFQHLKLITFIKSKHDLCTLIRSSPPPPSLVPPPSPPP